MLHILFFWRICCQIFPSPPTDYRFKILGRLLGIEPRTSCSLCKHSTFEMHPQPVNEFSTVITFLPWHYTSQLPYLSLPRTHFRHQVFVNVVAPYEKEVKPEHQASSKRKALDSEDRKVYPSLIPTEATPKALKKGPPKFSAPQVGKLHT